MRRCGVRGVLGALRYYCAGIFELLRDLTPERRRSRYGDIDYDFDHGVDTTWATVSLRTRLRELLSGGQYQPTEPELFDQILQNVPVEADGFTFIDLGSGKGRTLLMASDYPFRRIIGVELLAELDAIAQREHCALSERKPEVLCAGVSRGRRPRVPVPFRADGAVPVQSISGACVADRAGNLRESLEASPRPVFVVYHNPIHERVFAGVRVAAAACADFAIRDLSGGNRRDFLIVIHSYNTSSHKQCFYNQIKIGGISVSGRHQNTRTDSGPGRCGPEQHRQLQHFYRIRGRKEQHDRYPCHIHWSECWVSQHHGKPELLSGGECRLRQYDRQQQRVHR